jgi:hypothetical protein
MAGKDDLKLLSSYIYTKVKGLKDFEDDVHGIGAVVMNRATSLGSLTEAVQSLAPTPDMMEVMTGNIKGRDLKDYRRVIQLTSKMLRGSQDPTGGAIHFAPKRSKGGSLGLSKAHSTKHNNYFRESSSSGMQSMQEAPVQVV